MRGAFLQIQNQRVALYHVCLGFQRRKIQRLPIILSVFELDLHLELYVIGNVWHTENYVRKVYPKEIGFAFLLALAVPVDNKLF